MDQANQIILALKNLNLKNKNQTYEEFFFKFLLYVNILLGKECFPFILMNETLHYLFIRFFV